MVDQAKAQEILEALSSVEDETTAIAIVVEFLKHRPQIAPAVVAATVPDLTYAPARAITERRAKGTVKTVNHAQGYGFISAPEIAAVFGCDIFAHVKQIGSLQAGTPVSFAIMLSRDNKPQAFDVEELTSPGGLAMLNTNMGSMGASPAKGMMCGQAKGMMCGHASIKGGAMGAMSSSMKGSKGPGAASGCGGSDTELGQFEGTVKNFNQERGFGFITSEALVAQGYSDIYVHAKNIGLFQVGDTVTFTAFLHRGSQLQAKDLGGEPGNGMFASEPMGKMPRYA